MYQDIFVNRITKTEEQRYAPLRCFELDGRVCTFQLAGKKFTLRFHETKLESSEGVFDYCCLKCDDGVFLLSYNRRLLLINDRNGLMAVQQGDKICFADMTEAKPAKELIGWKVNFVFAAGNTITCTFTEHGLEYDEGVLNANVFSVGEDFYLVLCETGDGPLTLLMDTGRFLFSGFLAGELALGGYFENAVD